jgi:hypothetical protein
MPCGGQATYSSGVVEIECKGEWTCCQRAQAKEKVKNYNKQVPMNPQGVLDDDVLTDKADCCKDFWKTFKADMEKDPKAGAKKHATGGLECLADQIEKDWNNGKRDPEPMGLDGDHPIEVKIGGKAFQTLKALDEKVNSFFGRRLKVVANDMRNQRPPQKITAVHLICPNDPPCKPPPKPQSFSTGPGGKPRKERKFIDAKKAKFVTPAAR